MIKRVPVKRLISQLVLGLFCCGQLWVVTAAEPQYETAVDEVMDAAIADLREWITIQSITDAENSHQGDKLNQLEAVVARAEALGLAARILPEGPVAIVEMGPAKPAVGILVHADVVPAGSRTDWDAHPFSGDLRDGEIWGRGSLDDKGPLVATLYAMALANQLNSGMTRGVRMIVGSSEEDLNWGDLDAVRTAGLVPEFGWTADAAFPIINAEKSFANLVARFAPGEGETEQFRLSGGSAPNSVPDRALFEIPGAEAAQIERFEAAVADYHSRFPEIGVNHLLQSGSWQLEVSGLAAHGASPERGINAISHLVQIVAPLVDDATATGRLIGFIHQALGMETDGTTLGIARNNETMGATTVNLGVVKSSPGGIEAFFNVRAPAGLGVAAIQGRMAEAVTRHQGELRLDQAMEALYVNPDQPFIDALRQVYTEVTGEPADLRAIGGTTYAKAFPNFVAFGMAMPGDPHLGHAANERITVTSLRRGMLIYLQAILATTGIN
ncbi:MAG: Sapep family Mn(2+)-dependent dipeptidase [Gammaproteobacteria bacterium]|nr:Sapep family Mn(2+)-dependent dipeptidase [Gammaproteobacteria bacterium]